MLSFYFLTNGKDVDSVNLLSYNYGSESFLDDFWFLSHKRKTKYFSENQKQTMTDHKHNHGLKMFFSEYSLWLSVYNKTTKLQSTAIEIFLFSLALNSSLLI